MTPFARLFTLLGLTLLALPTARLAAQPAGASGAAEAAGAAGPLPAEMPSGAMPDDHIHGALGGPGAMQSTAITPIKTGGPAAPAQWDAAVAAAFARLPIQDQGRVKPMSTFARFELVKLSGKTTLKREGEPTLSASEWLLSVLFDPDRAATWKVIRIENPQLMQALGLSDEKKRAHFSFNDLRPAEAQMFDLARQIEQVPDRERNLFQRGLLNLFDQYTTLGNLLHAFQFARWQLPAEGQAKLRQWLPTLVREDTPLGRYSTLVPLTPFVLELLHPAPGAAAAPSEAEIRTVIEPLDDAAAMATALHLIPLTTDPEDEWASPGSLLTRMVQSTQPPLQQVELLRTLEELPALVADGGALARQLDAARTQALALFDNPRYAGKLALEQRFYEAKLFQRALALFILSFLLVALSWLLRRGGRADRVLAYVLPWTVIVPTLLLIAGITMRCLIRGRPPVSTLYETTLFVPAVAIVVALAVEWITRRRIALAVASALGVVGLFLANGYELKDGADTMTSLIAVLDSNFWLATHVTTVTIGYSAGLLAAALAHLYLIPRALGFKRHDPQYFRGIARMTYGVVCFGTLFSFVGTVLGGIWANYSWGRFWGWDPKENGALLIILWNLIILHGRMGGYLRDFGICLAAIFGGIIVAFSWWGVNLLGVGLHSYGFTSGILNALLTFTLVELMVMFLGMARALLERQLRAEAASAAAPPAQPATAKG